MLQPLLRDVRFFRALAAFDVDLAEETRQGGCVECRGALHRSRYPRKPRGLPSDTLKPAYSQRESFCCSDRDCRKRHTPPSFRFFGRRLYVGAIVVLVSAMTGGITERRAAALKERMGVSMRTLRRWRSWWRSVFVETPFWKGAGGRFAPPPPDPQGLPASLLERFTGPQPRDRLVACLRFLAPLTTRSWTARVV